MKNTSGKAVNRYYQIDGLTPRGATVVTVFVKADNIAQVRGYLAKAATIYKHWAEDCHNSGHFLGKAYDHTATRFKVSPVCWRYAMVCANGGLNITDNRTRHQIYNTDRDLADYIFHNTAIYHSTWARLTA